MTGIITVTEGGTAELVLLDQRTSGPLQLNRVRSVADIRSEPMSTASPGTTRQRINGKYRALQAAPALLCLAVSGCGSSGAPTTSKTASGPPAPTPVTSATRDAYIKKADALCLAFFSRVAPISAAATAAAGPHAATANPAEPFLHPRNRRGLGRAISNLSQASAQLLIELRALTPPLLDRAKVGAILNKMGLELTADEDLMAGIDASDRVAVVKALSQLSVEKLAFESSAQAFGFKVCGASRIPQRH
jgi:hypothetical protein